MRARELIWTAGGAAVGLALGGLLGVVAGAVIAAGVAVRPRAVLAAAALSSLAMAIVTLSEAGTDASRTRVFPALRPIAHQVGLVSALVWIAAGLVMWREAARQGAAGDDATPATRSAWPLIVLVPVAVVGTLVAID